VGRLVARIVARVLVGVLIAGATVYLGDWAVWRVRASRGSGMGKATVSRFVVAPLKGGKEEYYYDGTADVDCSVSLFPQGASNACWWVKRNPTVFDR